MLQVVLEADPELHCRVFDQQLEQVQQLIQENPFDDAVSPGQGHMQQVLQ